MTKTIVMILNGGKVIKFNVNWLEYIILKRVLGKQKYSIIDAPTLKGAKIDCIIYDELSNIPLKKFKKIKLKKGDNITVNWHCGGKVKKSEIIDFIAFRIKSAYNDLQFAKRNVPNRQDWIEGFRCRIDELLLIWHEIHNISFVDACKEFKIDYKEVNTEENG